MSGHGQRPCAMAYVPTYDQGDQVGRILDRPTVRTELQKAVYVVLKVPKTLHPGGIPTDDLMFQRQMQCRWGCWNERFLPWQQGSRKGVRAFVSRRPVRPYIYALQSCCSQLDVK
jgi:hypothetical protein